MTSTVTRPFQVAALQTAKSRLCAPSPLYSQTRSSSTHRLPWSLFPCPQFLTALLDVTERDARRAAGSAKVRPGRPGSPLQSHTGGVVAPLDGKGRVRHGTQGRGRSGE